jgi:hypothetical protein
MPDAALVTTTTLSSKRSFMPEILIALVQIFAVAMHEIAVFGFGLAGALDDIFLPFTGSFCAGFGRCRPRPSGFERPRRAGTALAGLASAFLCKPAVSHDFGDDLLGRSGDGVFRAHVGLPCWSGENGRGGSPFLGSPRCQER